jgi:hypothetical protein
MAVTRRKFVVELDVDSGDAVKGIQEVNKELDSVQDGAENTGEAFGMLDKMAGGAISSLKGVVGGVKTFIGSLTTLKGAIISTGIGALVVALGSLIAFFTRTKRGAELLERATAGLGAIVSVLTDALSGVGEMMVNAFENPQQAVADVWEAIRTNLVNRLKGLVDQALAAGKILEGAFTFDWDKVTEGAEEYGTAVVQTVTGFDKQQQQDIIDGFGEMADEMGRVYDVAVELQNAQQDLNDSNRELAVRTAQTRNEIKELNRIGEDITKTEEERIAALQRSIDIENDQMAARIANAEEQVRIIEGQLALSENLAEDEQKLADARIELARIQTESNELLLTQENKLRTVYAQGEAKRQEQRKAEIEFNNRLLEIQDEITTSFLTDQEKQVKAVNDKYDELEKEAKGNAETMLLIAEARERDLKKIEDDAEALKELEDNAKKAKEKAAEQQHRDDLQMVRDELLNNTLSQQEIEINAVQVKYNEMASIAGDNAELQKQIEEQKNQAILDINNEYRQMEQDAQEKADKKAEDDAEKLFDKRVAIASGSFSTLANLASEFQTGNEKQQRRAFEVNKALSISSALIDTYGAAIAAYKSALEIPGAGIFLAQTAAATAVVTGLINVNKIRRQQFNSSAAGGASTGGIGGIAQPTPQQQPLTPQLDTNFLQGNEPEPIQAYVLGNDVNSTAEARQKIQDQTVL